ncbi:MAG: type II secretion system protein [Gammaproteobacteria bacterium]|nr:type II secretion system protein [Gammaproteobacteria bacterium]MCK5262965.1 type II secretion system protein [Gammaproteobacteria bacterium]
MNINKSLLIQKGFTLVELAIVLVIVGVLLGGFIGTLASRIESTQRSNTQDQLEDIKSALLGYVSAEGYLPCPTTTTGGGEEQSAGGSCTIQHGFVPGRTLGLSGAYNFDDLLLDTWGNPIRYSVSDDGGTDAFTTPYTAPGAGGMKDVGMAALGPDLVVCSEDSAAGTTCSAGNTLLDNSPFILLSLGKDGNEFVANTANASTDQGENSAEADVTANATGENLAYSVGNNRVFVSKSYSGVGATADQFDDIILWVSPYILYSRMIEAGQLP